MNRIDAHRNDRWPASAPGPAPGRGLRTAAWTGLAHDLGLAPAERSHVVATTAERAYALGAGARPGRSAPGGPMEVTR
ncbi:hypothetical protein [Streptomyces sp. S.PB5]|uniref:hypothetical protein n=1 Tax=Streptomyces sp. S.PB5 TaxID=3020844 RepID=UPI0025AF202C|nr:hypothetical protein [Streptomyces sp. S.PB5]MDN3026121.1 hypothetical protein [Streptomyces sp. S.PB5]